MGCYCRLFIPIFLLILAVSAVRYHVLLDTETALANSRYQNDARQLNLYLANTVLPVAVQANMESLRDNVQQALRGAL
ncbi:MAG: GGDEF domain-containing protein, partial [Janthinobacterium sp.]